MAYDIYGRPKQQVGYRQQAAPSPYAAPVANPNFAQPGVAMQAAQQLKARKGLAQQVTQPTFERAQTFGQPAGFGKSPGAVTATGGVGNVAGNGWVNLQDYMGLNQAKGAEMASDLADGVGKRAEGVRGDMKAAWNDFAKSQQQNAQQPPQAAPGAAQVTPGQANAVATQAQAQTGFPGQVVGAANNALNAVKNGVTGAANAANNFLAPQNNAVQQGNVAVAAAAPQQGAAPGAAQQALGMAGAPGFEALRQRADEVSRDAKNLTDFNKRADLVNKQWGKDTNDYSGGMSRWDNFLAGASNNGQFQQAADRWGGLDKELGVMASDSQALEGSGWNGLDSSAGPVSAVDAMPISNYGALRPQLLPSTKPKTKAQQYIDSWTGR